MVIWMLRYSNVNIIHFFAFFFLYVLINKLLEWGFWDMREYLLLRQVPKVIILMEKKPGNRFYGN